jgi:hypothetical protein
MGIFFAPTAWAFQLVFVSQLEETSCDAGGSGHGALIAAVSIVALLIAAVGILASWRFLSASPGETESERSTSRRIGQAGAGSSVLFMILIGLGFAYALAIGACEF